MENHHIAGSSGRRKGNQPLDSTHNISIYHWKCQIFENATFQWTKTRWKTIDSVNISFQFSHFPGMLPCHLLAPEVSAPSNNIIWDETILWEIHYTNVRYHPLVIPLNCGPILIYGCLRRWQMRMRMRIRSRFWSASKTCAHAPHHFIYFVKSKKFQFQFIYMRNFLLK